MLSKEGIINEGIKVSLTAYQEFPGDSMLKTIKENNKLYFCVPADANDA